MNKVNPNHTLQREMLGFALHTPTYGLEPIERYYKGKLERKFQEYKDTHKEQIDPALLSLYDGNITQVNTISYFIGEK